MTQLNGITYSFHDYTQFIFGPMILTKKLNPFILGLWVIIRIKNKSPNISGVLQWATSTLGFSFGYESEKNEMEHLCRETFCFPFVCLYVFLRNNYNCIYISSKKYISMKSGKTIYYNTPCQLNRYSNVKFCFNNFRHYCIIIVSYVNPAHS